MDMKGDDTINIYFAEKQQNIVLHIYVFKTVYL